MTRRRVRLTRMWVKTDYDPKDPEYVGAHSSAFMAEDNRQIVNVDWSVPGEVCITYLRPDDNRWDLDG